MLVIDASVALAWLFEDERHDGTLALLVARRLYLPLATLDTELNAAARAARVPLAMKA